MMKKNTIVSLLVLSMVALSGNAFGEDKASSANSTPQHLEKSKTAEATPKAVVEKISADRQLIEDEIKASNTPNFGVFGGETNSRILARPNSESTLTPAQQAGIASFIRALKLTGSPRPQWGSGGLSVFLSKIAPSD